MGNSVEGYLVLSARLALGLVFLAAGVGKLLQRDAAGKSPAGPDAVEYTLLPRRLARLYRGALPCLELGTALLLVAGPLLPTRSALRVLPFFVAAGLLTVFSASVAITLGHGVPAECHCFGRFGGGRVTARTLGRNLLLLSLAGVGVSGRGLRGPHLAGTTVASALLPAALLAVSVLGIVWMLVEGVLASATGRRFVPRSAIWGRIAKE